MARSFSALSEPLTSQRIPGEADLFGLHCARPEQYPHLLESARHRGGRYSVLFAEPEAERQLLPGGDVGEFLAALNPQGPFTDHPGLPFSGGWLIYLGYELAREFEPHLAGMPVAAGQPVARAVYCGAAIIVDHQRSETLIVSQGENLRAHRQRLEGAKTPPPTGEWQWREDAPAAYLQAVQRAVEYIRAGDVYQVNLSRRWHGPAASADRMLAAYGQLRERNPAPFSASLRFEDFGIASASPERLFSVDGSRIQTRPIAGTRPRGATEAEDQALRAELAANSKERAEHIMLVDLERHDLGRICRAGSVRVDELEVLESYASVHHLVSNIRGELQPGIGIAQILPALFPGGTITGCPKIRCMQIIAELEGRPRGAYTGSIGYISHSGAMDFNILIRSLVWEQGRCHFDAGAGIVADSDPERELQETRAKAAGLIRALAS